MRYVAVFFWAIILGQIAGFIGGALNQQTYNFNQTIYVSLIFAVIFTFVPLLLKDKKSTK
ncbi:MULTISPECIES: YjzD family protein [Lactobacillaceae]|uniref:YjzD family protein n=1 Tax=Lactobacillaceae TaxID=33958 RepID=UPI000C1B74E0|nr:MULTISPECIES: YjzD family protein [Lactobacillaceae]